MGVPLPGGAATALAATRSRVERELPDANPDAPAQRNLVSEYVRMDPHVERPSPVLQACRNAGISGPRVYLFQQDQSSTLGSTNHGQRATISPSDTCGSNGWREPPIFAPLAVMLTCCSGGSPVAPQMRRGGLSEKERVSFRCRSPSGAHHRRRKAHA